MNRFIRVSAVPVLIDFLCPEIKRKNEIKNMAKKSLVEFRLQKYFIFKMLHVAVFTMMQNV